MAQIFSDVFHHTAIPINKFNIEVVNLFPQAINAVPRGILVNPNPMAQINQVPNDDTLTCLDLFCGCGGFTLGMQRAGFHVLAAIDFSPDAVATLRANLVEKQHPAIIPVAHALERDLTRFPPEELAELIGTQRLDVIVGGPPCQGFSTARQVDGANHGARIKDDPRRFLYREFLRYVKYFKVRAFVMENVLGIRTAVGGQYFTRVQNEARDLGYRVHAQVEDAWELGVPQKRRRQLIIGIRQDLPGYFLPQIKAAPRAEPRISLGAAICDLPVLRAGGGEDERDYHFARTTEHGSCHAGTTSNYLLNVIEVNRAAKLTNHVARPHSERDLRDFSRLREGENSATAMRDRGVHFEFPYDKSSFKDRYTRQSRSQPCSTIVAHLSKDGLMFIHPTQNRSLTPREAARIQSFPDWFRFPKARTHAFRLIGNAVPPLVGEAVGLQVKEFLATSYRIEGEASQTARPTIRLAVMSPNSVPSATTRADAAARLEYLANLSGYALRAIPNQAFLQGWRTLLALFPNLHPDNARDHGNNIEEVPVNPLGLPHFERTLTRRYTRSGWPVALASIGREALRRHARKQITLEQLYCIEGQGGSLMCESMSRVSAH